VIFGPWSIATFVYLLTNCLPYRRAGTVTAMRMIRLKERSFLR